MTRFNQIRNMSIDKMAKCFSDADSLLDKICKEQNRCPYMNKEGNLSDDCDCTNCAKSWLESEGEI